MPPSPSLSAFKMKITYLMVTTMVRDQKIRDMTPRRLAWVRAMAWIAVEAFLDGVQGAGADVPIDHAQGAQGQDQCSFQVLACRTADGRNRQTHPGLN